MVCLIYIVDLLPKQLKFFGTKGPPSKLMHVSAAAIEFNKLTSSALPSLTSLQHKAQKSNEQADRNFKRKGNQVRTPCAFCHFDFKTPLSI